MKRFNYYLSLMLLLVFTAACNDEFDQPPMVVPQASRTANMTIAEFKAKHWQDAKNYIDTVKEDEVIHGWITSSDEAGNVYKQIYISDGTAGLTISIDQSSLYNKYRLGQEVVLPMKDLFIGKFNGLLCLGVPYYWPEGNAWESNRMSYEFWENMVELNGFPDVSKVDTTLIELSEIKDATSRDVLLKYMSRLVRINSVKFSNAGEPFSLADESTDRLIVDEEGNSISVYNSNYASFRADLLPEGKVDVVGELSYTSSKGFHIILRMASDVITSTMGGTRGNPHTIAQALAEVDKGLTFWYGGYVVGAVGPEVTTVTSNDDIEWSSPSTLNTTLVLADDPECKDYTKCMIVPLPQGSSFRAEANMHDNPKIYKTFVKVKGQSASYMGAVGLSGNEGTMNLYVLNIPITEMEEGFRNGIPSTWTNIAVSGGHPWGTYAYPAAAPTTFCAQFRINNETVTEPVESWLITPLLDIKNARSKVFNFMSEVNNVGNDVIEVYLLDSKDPTTATVKEKLNPILPSKPTSGTYSAWTSSGDIDLSDWADGAYYVGFCFKAPAGSNFTTWCINGVTFGKGEPTPPATHADFETMPGNLGEWGNFTSKKGWTATNCMLLKGSDVDNNPEFKFITKGAIAPTLNGNTSSVGKIVSPVLHDGMTKLRFKYGYAFSGKVIHFRVDVKQNGNVVKSWDISQQDVSKYTVFDFEEALTVNGDFTIEITNLSPSAAASEKDRLSIWDLEWDQ